MPVVTESQSNTVFYFQYKLQLTSKDMILNVPCFKKNKFWTVGNPIPTPVEELFP